jgi:dUTP pyrophosphatase
MNIEMKLLPNYPGDKPPSRGSEHAAGIDLVNAEGTAVTIGPGQTHWFKTGICVAIPPAHCALVLGRSGNAKNKGVFAPQTGLIDCDYRGEIRAAVTNTNHFDIAFQPGDRIAQLLILPYIPASPAIVINLPQTARGDGGFGSTGN